MAIGWIALLTKVPWLEVISNALRVADAAKKLLKAVANKSVPSETLTDVVPPYDSASVSGMEARLVAMEAGIPIYRIKGVLRFSRLAVYCESVLTRKLMQ